MGKSCHTMIFFRNRTNGGQTDSGARMCGRGIMGAMAFYNAIETVGRYNIKTTVMLQADGEIMISLFGGSV